MVDAPTRLDFEKGLMFFHAYMYGPLQGKLRLYRARDVSPTTVASPTDWEVLASILTGDPGTGTTDGIDLHDYEVKSARQGSAFEYQYHRNSWAEKLHRDMAVGHLFFMHQDNLGKVELWFARGEDMAPDHFDRWLAEKPYSSPGQQRFRKNVSRGWVLSNGTMLMALEGGEVTFPASGIIT